MMKHKTFSFLLTMLMSMVACVASAHNFVVNGIYYYITSSTDLTVSVTYKGDSYSSYSNEYTGSVAIPEMVTHDGKNYSVTSISNYAFSHCSGLTSVTIPNSVASIGRYAFSYCSGLTSVTIPNSVTAIGESAFSHCGGLTSVTINSNAIASMSYKTSSTLSAIFGSQVKEYVFGDGVKSIGSYACYNCTNIPSVTIPNSVTSIGYSAFSGCSGLTSVTINSNTIAAKAYSSSSTLSKIFGEQVKEYVFGEGVKSIGSYACYNCTSLTSVTIPNSVTSIGDDAFSSCSGLTSITIPNGVTSIGNYTFSRCSGLTSVAIPNSVTSIAGSAFYYCSGLTKAEFASVESLCNIKFSNSASNPLSYAHKLCIDGKEVTDLVIPNSVTSIGSSAFYGCSGLTSVTIPNSVTSIGEGAFGGCSGLTSVTIPSSVTSIGSSAFKGTAWYNKQSDGLIYAGNIAYEYKGTMPQGTEIILKEGTVGIAESAFSGCSGLTSVTIPNSVTSMGSSAFWGCSGLISVTIPNSVTSIGSSAFYRCSSLTSVTINSNAIASTSYQSSSTLSGIFGSQVREYNFGDGVKSIGNYACYNCADLISVTIPNSVTSIGRFVFSGCSGLTSVTIPNNVTSIGWYAFFGCSGLTSVTIPENLVSIGGYAFSGCSGLTSVTIPNSVTSIGDYAFEGCSGLTKVEFASVESLCNIQFSNSASNPLYYVHKLYIDGKEVTDLVIPNSVNLIGNYTFRGCSGLASVAISKSVTSIGSSAFEGCSGLTSVTIPSSVTSIGSSAFSDCGDLTSVTINSNAIASMSYDSSSTLTGIFGSQVKKYVFGYGVRHIGSFACHNCRNLTSVTISNSVASIDGSAFYGCSGLTTIAIPKSSVASIGETAFSGCSGLTSVTIPSSVTSIGNSAFSGCSGLTSVTIPISVTSIGSSAFGGCSRLTSVTVNSNAIASMSYSSSQTLSGFFGPQVKEYVFGDGIGSIGSYACYNCTNLTSVTIPNSVTSIGNRAFYGCSGLTSVTIPQTVTSIGSYAFSGCRGLTSVTIPENLTTIGSNVFDGCDACSIYVKKGTDILLRLWADGYVPYDITTHERLVTPGVEIQESTATSMKCNLTNLYEEYAYQLSFEGQPVGTTSFYQTGLEPNHEYTVSLTIAENKAKPFVCNVLNKVKVKTAALELTPQQPKVVSEGNVVVEAASNIQNDAEKVGVEWRRVDWTSDFPSNSATAYLFNGTIQGYIRNLNTNYLWKFRAFYESASGNRYYSGWMGIDPTNTSYFEPTVHTYAEHSVEGNSAQVRGYAQRGSENVTAQGFMYWPVSAEVKAHRDGALAKVQAVPADAVQVEAKGTVMQTSLEGLNYNTTYNYVAFMTTSDGETYYGEQQAFTIGEDLTPVESVEVAPKAASIVAIYDASGRKQPRMQHGVNIVRMSDGTVRKIMVK